LNEAIIHAGIANTTKIDFHYIDSEKITKKNYLKRLQNLDGILVPGGFGARGIEGKILAIQYARENRIPFYGICLGMQVAAIEFARDVCGIKTATSREFDMKTKAPIIDFMEDQKNKTDKGGTMRLGAYRCSLIDKALA